MSKVILKGTSWHVYEAYENGKTDAASMKKDATPCAFSIFVSDRKQSE